MNTEQANAIPMSSVLEKIGYLPATTSGHDLYYLSPFRNERTPSFHVNAKVNVWYDHGEGKGGTVIDFVIHYLLVHNEDHTVADALRWLRNMRPSNNPIISKTGMTDDGPKLELLKVLPLRATALISYINFRGISYSLARRYLKEVHFLNKNSGETFFALGLKNENGGFELRNKFFKGCIAPKTISFFRGSKLLPDQVHIFEGFMDYLSALMHYNVSQLEGDAIVLNSLACLPLASPYIRDYSYKVMHSWLDNDPAGENATAILKEHAENEWGLSFEKMNGIYEGHKDVNAWHMTRFHV